MKKNYISPEILVLNANIMSELLSGSGSGSGKYDFGGGQDGNTDPGGGSVGEGGDDDGFVQGSKGDSWSIWDD